jgi:preprotein translocase subunit Sec63
LIVIRADDVEVFRGQISPGEVKNFEAQNNISVSADKGKYVGVKINDKNFGTLSKDTKAVTNRVFTAE